MYSRTTNGPSFLLTYESTVAHEVDPSLNLSELDYTVG